MKSKGLNRYSVLVRYSLSEWVRKITNWLSCLQVGLFTWSCKKIQSETVSLKCSDNLVTMWAYLSMPLWQYQSLLQDPVLQVILGHDDGYSWCRLVSEELWWVSKELAMKRQIVLGAGCCLVQVSIIHSLYWWNL